MTKALTPSSNQAQNTSEPIEDSSELLERLLSGEKS